MTTEITKDPKTGMWSLQLVASTPEEKGRPTLYLAGKKNAHGHFPWEDVLVFVSEDAVVAGDGMSIIAVPNPTPWKS